MLTQPKIGIEIDIKRMTKSLDNIGKVAMPKAAAYKLNGAAFSAQRVLARSRKLGVISKATPRPD